MEVVVVDDGSTDAERDPLRLDDEGADHHGEVRCTGEREVAESTRVDAAWRRLECVDDVHRPQLGSARHRAPRERVP